MTDAPEKIWASSVTDTYGEWQTTLDGLPRPTEYTRSDLVAELEAENERLRKDRDYWKIEAEGERAKVEYRDRMTSEALSRTGAVKVEGPAIKEFRRIFHTTRFTDDVRYQPELIAAVLGEIDDTFSTHEPASPWSVSYANSTAPGRSFAPAAPEGQQPVADNICPDCKRVKAQSAGDAARGLCPKWWAIMDEMAERDCCSHTRPSKQAVTEAQVDAFNRVYDRTRSIKEALKAAMEAGR